MDIWDILGIEISSNIKTIKRAYAKKLKTTRPNENPIGFQQLHFAYKQALFEVKYGGKEEHSISNGIEPLSMKNTHADTYHDQSNFNESLIKFEVPLEGEASQETLIGVEPNQIFQEEIQLFITEEERLIDWVSTLINDGSKRHQFNLWQKIMETRFILVPEFNRQLGYKIFKMIAEHNVKNRSKKRKYNRIEQKMLRHLDEVFNWTGIEADLRYELGDRLCNVIFLKLTHNVYGIDEERAIGGIIGGGSIKKVVTRHQKPVEYFYYGANSLRFSAFLIDLVICLSCAFFVFLMLNYIFDEIPQSARNMFLFYSVIGLYNIGSYFFECSQLQATPGKMLFGLRVTNDHNGRVSYWHGLGRAISFAILSIGVYLTLIINSWISPKYMHDRISRTQVIDLKLSKKKQS